jgi:hypothetical protein
MPKRSTVQAWGLSKPVRWQRSIKISHSMSKLKALNSHFFGTETAPLDFSRLRSNGHVERPKVSLQATFYRLHIAVGPGGGSHASFRSIARQWPLFAVGKTSHFNRWQSHSEPRRSHRGQSGGWAQRATHLPGFGGGKRFHGFLPVDKAICAQKLRVAQPRSDLAPSFVQ